MAEARAVKGPMGGPPARGMPRKKVKKGTLKRLVGYIAKGNKLKLFAVVLCIAVSAGANVGSSLFIKMLIAD